ncbi:SH2 domain-containing protein 7-like isoform 2-T2 [Polymixia lowei]
MLTKMTLGSNHSLLISPTEVKRTCSALFRQLKPRFQKSCNILGKMPLDKKHSKAHCFRTCLMLHHKDRTGMERRDPSVESMAERTEGGLRHLALKWFTETQAPLILHNGIFPTWFQGFIDRKNTEDTLRDKEVGCFLIRLSDKAIGYILSYKGKNRCRHFVINQSQSGQFVVSGDTQVHDTLSDLIEYYKTYPIEPFGEYLTSSCFEESTRGLYDIIQVSCKEKPVVSVRVVENVKDQWGNRTSELPPKLPPKSTPKEIPPLPRTGRALKSGSLDDQTSAHGGVLYAQLEKHRPREITRVTHSCQESSPEGSSRRAEGSALQSQACLKNNISGCSGDAPGSGTVYSELSLLDRKSRSLPLLDDDSDEQQSYKLSAFSPAPPRLSPESPREACCHSLPQEQTKTCSRPTSSHSLDYLCNSPIYYLAGRPGRQLNTDETRSFPSDRDSMYADVPGEATRGRFLLENTYEQIPWRAESNTYESLEDLRTEHASRGIKNDRRRRFFPEIKKK